MNHQPLAGITVLDLGQIYNGPYCGYLLAMAGARVIKVEPPGGERMRGTGDTLVSYPFMMLNGNKESVTLNLKAAAGRDLLRNLARHADVLLENFAPGTLDRHGVGADALTAINPRLIYAAGTGFGRTGPHRDYRAMDITVQAMTGVMAITGHDGEPPLKAGPAMCDILGGVHLYAAITTALVRRERTGHGAVLDVAMQDAVFPSLTSALGAWYVAGGESRRTGNHHHASAVAPYNVYAARDGHVAIICVRERHWLALLDAMGKPELADDPRFTDRATRARNMEATDAVVEAWTSTHSKADVFQVCQQHRVPCAPVQSLADVLNDPHLLERVRPRQNRPRTLRRGGAAQHAATLPGRRSPRRVTAEKRRRGQRIGVWGIAWSFGGRRGFAAGRRRDLIGDRRRSNRRGDPNALEERAVARAKVQHGVRLVTRMRSILDTRL